ncbi:MAG: metallopeptidase TldD-related protein [Thermoanaerobaculia bacterium]
MTARLLGALGRSGFELAEALTKTGRSQSVALGGEAEGARAARERGWAVRVGTGGRALFVAGSGEPPESGEGWPEPVEGALRLPPPRAVPSWRPPADLDAPLLGEAEGFDLLRSVASRLARQLPGAGVVTASIEDGASESRVVNSRGVEAAFRSRGATTWLEGVREVGDRRTTAVVEDWAPAARTLLPERLAARLADRLVVEGGPDFEGRERWDVVLAPAAAARLLSGLLPLFVGIDAPELWKEYRDRTGRIGSAAVRVVDDGRAPFGLPVPVDAEGMPTRRIVLVDAGAPRQPLLAWEQADPPATVASGCTRRPGWRDRPERGPTHLFLEGDGQLAPSALLAGVRRGAYLLEAFAGGSIDVQANRFSLPVAGFALRNGGVAGAFRRARLQGSIGAFLHGVEAAARDVRLFALDGLIGAPTLRVTGLELSG